MSRPEWLNEPRIRAAIEAAVASAPPLTDDQLDFLRRSGFLKPASATTSPSHGSAAVVEGDAVGAAGLVRGSASPSRPTNGRKRAVAAARLQDNAG